VPGAQLRGARDRTTGLDHGEGNEGASEPASEPASAAAAAAPVVGMSSEY